MELDITIDNGQMIRVGLVDELGKTVATQAVEGDMEGQALIDIWRAQSRISDPAPFPEE